MEKKVEEIVTEKAVELLESKKDEILEKVAEQLEEKKEEIEKKVDEVADKAEETVEKAAEEVGKKIEEAAKPLTDLIDKLDDNPQIAAVLEGIVSQVDGREISCSCFGWMFALRIHRKSTDSPPSKSEDLQKIEIASPSQDVQEKETVPPTVPRSE
jgi:ElaB/YqjD/DUF883 family membrane-anchored ribosome-binding protein